jgi:transcriptional regulator of acetoin/glycerol metabolism
LPRWTALFVTIACGAFSEILLESELLGYMKGVVLEKAGDACTQAAEILDDQLSIHSSITQEEA